MTANEFSREEVVAMEKEIALAIDFNFHAYTVVDALFKLKDSDEV